MGYRRSSVPNLYRDERTGIYYVRTKVHGRTIWKTLQTNEFSLQKGRNALSSLERGSATFGSLAELYKGRIQSDTRLKPSSKIYRCQTIDAILRFRRNGTKDSSVTSAKLTVCGGRPRTAVKFTERVSTIQSEVSGYFRGGLAEWALSGQPGTIYTQGARKRKRLRLPSAEQFADILGNIESSGAWCAYDAADLVRFLAYSGCRIQRGGEREAR